MRQPGSPSDVLFFIPLHSSQAPYRLQEPGTKTVMPSPVFSAPGKSHSRGCGVLGAHVLLAACIFPSCWKCLHHAGLVPSSALSKTQPEREQPPQADLSQSQETSNPVSSSHSSLLHVLVNPNKFGYVHLSTGKNKT